LDSFTHPDFPYWSHQLTQKCILFLFAEVIANQKMGQ